MMLVDDKKANVLANFESQCFLDTWTKEQIESEFQNNPFFHAWMTKEGYAFVWEAYEQAELVRIGILPTYRKQGYAHRLLTKCMAHAKQAGCETMTLEVRVSNIPAIRLYEMCGFIKSHCSKHHYQDGEDAWIMICEL